MRKTMLLAFLLLGLVTFAYSQTLPPAEQPAVDAVFAKFTKPGSPGCALGVYRNGAMAFAKGYGLASLELEVPITPQTVFDIGSTSKQFTGFAILLLEQQGKLSLDDDVRKFIPELPDYGKALTLRHLLTHTSGLRDYAGLFELAGVPTQNITTDQDALDLIARQKRLNFMPGAEWDYSNSGFFLLSQVVKRVAGKSLRDFAQENIFTPLGMKSTQIYDWHGLVIAHRATGYTWDDERKTFAVEMSNFEQAGDGSVQTSVEDLLRWDENFYTAKVGGADLLRRMQVAGKLNNGEVHGYAAGLMIGAYRGLPTVRHGGAWAGYRAELLRFPKQHTSVAVLCNQAESGPSQLANQVADVVLASALGPKPEPASAAAKTVKLTDEWLRARAGWYRNDAGEYRRVEFKDGKLYMGRRAGIELLPESETSFQPKGSDVTLTFSDHGVSVRSPGRSPVAYALVPATPSGDVSRFAGKYYSEELQNTWEFRVEKGELGIYARPVFDGSEPLVPVGEGTFTIAGGEIRFVSKPGEPMKAIVSLARMREIEFVRRK